MTSDGGMFIGSIISVVSIIFVGSIIIDLLWQHGTTYTQQNLSFFGKSVQVWTIYLKNGGSSWLPVFFNEILNDFSSDRSWFLRNQWHSFSIKRVYFSTFIFQQKYLDISSFLKRHFRTFSSGTGEPFKVLGWNIDRSLEKSILSLWTSFLLANLKQFFLKMVHT